MELIKIENGVKMTSLELAEITGKNHADVLRDIRDEIEKLGEKGLSIFAESSYINSQNKKQPMFEFSKKGAMQIALRYSAEIRFKVIEKLEELENKNSPALPQNYLEALKALVVSEEKRIEAEKTNAILMHVNKNYTVTEIAKELNLKSATQLNKILADKKIQYKSNGTWVLYSKYSNLGYFDIKQEVLETGKVIYHRKVTQLGRKFIIDLIGGSEIKC